MHIYRGYTTAFFIMHSVTGQVYFMYLAALKLKHIKCIARNFGIIFVTAEKRQSLKMHHFVKIYK